MSIGIPIKLLHEGVSHTVTIELKNGEIYRGILQDAEDNMNCQMVDITRTARDGKITQLEAAYIRGSQIRFMILPDMLKQAPLFKKISQKGKGTGFGTMGRGTGGRGRGRGGGRGRGR